MTITSMEPRDYIEEDNLADAIQHMEQAAALLGGEVTHVTCCDSQLRKCKKYVITYDRQ